MKLRASAWMLGSLVLLGLLAATNAWASTSKVILIEDFDATT